MADTAMYRQWKHRYRRGGMVREMQQSEHHTIHQDCECESVSSLDRSLHIAVESGPRSCRRRSTPSPEVRSPSPEACRRAALLAPTPASVISRAMRVKSASTATKPIKPVTIAMVHRSAPSWLARRFARRIAAVSIEPSDRPCTASTATGRRPSARSPTEWTGTRGDSEARVGRSTAGCPLTGPPARQRQRTRLYSCGGGDTIYAARLPSPAF